jgi:hypothetical protein
MRDATRERSGCETVFAVLKVLMAGYVLWGTSSGIDVAHLAHTVGVTDGALTVALDYLIDDGLAEVDGERRLARLTARGARRLLVTGARCPQRPCAVEFRATAWH